MALLLMESCDLENANAGAAKWGEVNASMTDGVSVGGKTCWSNSQQVHGLKFNLASGDEDTTMVVGMRVRTTLTGVDSGNSSERQFLTFSNGGTIHVDLVQRASNTIAAHRLNTELGRTDSDTFFPNQWYYLEFKAFIHDTTGTIEVKLDGTQVLSLTSQDTRNGGTAAIDNISFGAMRNATFYYRDIVVMNTAGASLDDFQGPVLVEAVVPDGAGNYTDWTADTGNNWDRVNESDPDDDTSYVETSAAADRDSYTFGDLSAITTAPLAVQATAFLRYTDSALDTAMMLRRSATDDDGTAATPTGSYAPGVREIWETDPVAAGAWTVSNFNATEFGVKT